MVLSAGFEHQVALSPLIVASSKLAAGVSSLADLVTT